MSWLHIFWDVQPGGNAAHIGEHGLDLNDVEYVLNNPASQGVSRASGRPFVRGYTRSGEYIMVVYDELDEDTVTR